MVLVTLSACNQSKEIIPATPKEVAPSSTAVAKIETADEFFNFLDKIDKMKEEELNEWEKTRNFTSYRTVWKQAKAEWDSLRTDADEAAFLEKYSDILEMKDNAIEPLILSPFYQAICNRDGIFATSGGLTRIYREHSLNDSTGNYAKLMSVPEKSLGPAARVMSTGDGEIIYLRDVAEVHSDNWNGCSGISRRINFKVLVYIYRYNFVDELEYYAGPRIKFQHRVQFLAWASKIRWWGCKWVRYNSEIKFRNLKIEYDELYSDCRFPRDEPFVRSSKAELAYYASPEGVDVPHLAKEFNMNPRDVIRKSYFNTHTLVNTPTSVKGSGEATTRGMGGRWVPITFNWKQPK